MLQGAAGSDLVKLEDPAFEKQFVVRASDQVEARYVLSPALMARMLDFKNQTGRDVQFSLVGSNIYVAIPFSSDLFEPKLWSSGLDMARIRTYFDAIEMTARIVEALNLNTRIWTKT
jgi:hypothetical protein